MGNRLKQIESSTFQKVKFSDDLTQDTKLTNDSFQMVLSFVDIRRRQFHPLLKSLKPSGSSFYQKHVVTN